MGADCRGEWHWYTEKVVVVVVVSPVNKLGKRGQATILQCAGSGLLFESLAKSN